MTKHYMTKDTNLGIGKNGLKKWLGTRVMFEFSFTSKILRLIITNNNSIDEPNGLKDNFLQFFQRLGLGPVHPVHWI